MRAGRAARARTHRLGGGRRRPPPLAGNAAIAFFNNFARDPAITEAGHASKRDKAMVLLGAANRDERRFAEPDRFDIVRQDLDVEHAFTSASGHVAFGLGRHFCVGSLLAKYELTASVEQLLDAMDDIRFADGPPAEHGISVRGFKHMPLTCTSTARA